MKKIFISLFCTLLLSLSAAPRVAVFDEPGFPNASKRDAGFYRKALDAKILRLNELDKLKNCEIHSTVILSHVDEKTFKALGMRVTCEPQRKTVCQNVKV